MEDYKQKYEIAIKKAKEELKTCGTLDCDAARQIFRFFPELKKSEDERIRKEIIQFLQLSPLQFIGERNQEKWIAWLEKQDPKKHEEELENAYKCADEVQYRRGYEDAKREFASQGEQKFVDKCKDCNNVKGCITCTEGDQYAHITEQKTTDKIEPKKKLKKIKQTYFQKQEWTGYDEKAYEIALLDIDKSPSITKNDSINWLKSLKERMKGE